MLAGHGVTAFPEQLTNQLARRVGRASPGIRARDDDEGHLRGSVRAVLGRARRRTGSRRRMVMMVMIVLVMIVAHAGQSPRLKSSRKMWPSSTVTRKTS